MKVINFIVSLILYSILIKQIANPANTVGLQLLLVLVLIAFLTAEVVVFIQTHAVRKL